MTIRHLKIFLAVAEYKTMSAAAEKLYISQPTVSQAIRELEEHYHGLLFERLGKKLYLTEMGKILLTRSRDLVQEFQRLDDSMVEQGKKMMLRLGSTLTVGTCLTPEIILHLEEKFPGIEVRSYVSNTQEIEEKLLKMELDVGIIEGQAKHHDLIQIPIIDDMLVLVCNTEHPFAKLDAVAVSDLEGQNFVMREDGSGTRELFEKTLDMYNVHIKTVFEENTPGAIMNAVLINNCLCVISARLAEKEAQAGHVKLFVRESQGWNRSFSLVYHKDKLYTSSMEKLQSILLNYKNSHVLSNIRTGILLD